WSPHRTSASSSRTPSRLNPQLGGRSGRPRSFYLMARKTSNDQDAPNTEGVGEKNRYIVNANAWITTVSPTPLATAFC
ncbi:hypothetical protein, partial [Pseudomonas aeruginosa]|uniref:hypothetical protein n=1 Tax=Pseudomonas aeruginosa TaxID=287 RepID=UPI001C3131DA